MDVVRWVGEKRWLGPAAAVSALICAGLAFVHLGLGVDHKRAILWNTSNSIANRMGVLRLRLARSLYLVQQVIEHDSLASEKTPHARQALLSVSDTQVAVLREIDECRGILANYRTPRLAPDSPSRAALYRALSAYQNHAHSILAESGHVPLADGEPELDDAAAAYERTIDILDAEGQAYILEGSEALYRTSRSYSTLALIFGLLAVGVGSAAVASRFRALFYQAVKDRIKLEGAIEDLVAAKTALQHQNSDVEEALEEARSKTQLFEHASNRFQQLFGGLPLGCLTYDRDGIVQEWNPAMTDLVGLDGFVGCYQPVEFVFRGEGADAPISEIVQEVIEKGVKRTFEWAHITLEGRIIHAFYVTYPLRSLSGTILGGIVAGFNITERKNAEEALLKSEERYQTAVAASSTGIFDWNIKDGIQHWSPRVLEILDLPEDFEPGPFTLTEMVHPDDLPEFRRELDTHLAGCSDRFSSEVRVSISDGTTRWILIRGEAIFDEAGAAVRMAGSIDDIHQRKQAEVALAESESRFRDVTEAAGEFIFELDSAGRILLVSPRITEITGHLPEELIGASFATTLPGAWRTLIRKGLRRAIRAQGRVNEFSIQTQDKSGHTIWLRITATPYFDGKGSFVGYRGTGLDITHEVEASDQLAQAHRMLHDTLESIRDCFFSLDDEYRFVYVNSAAAASLGAAQHDLMGAGVWEIMNRAVAHKLKARFDSALTHRIEQAFELLDPNSGHWYQYRVYPREQGISVFYQDITQRKSFESQIEAQMQEINEKNMILQIQQKNLEDANKRLATLATTDGLTGLKNHKAFQSSLADLCEEAQASGEPMSLILLDVDHFKKYNDTFGHPAGDEVLRSVAMVLKNLGRRGDVVARYGGEEFVLILPGVGPRDAEKAAERIRQGIAENSWPHRPITASLGVASWESGALVRTELVDQADSALYCSKREGRNRVTVWAPSMDKRAA